MFQESLNSLLDQETTSRMMEDRVHGVQAALKTVPTLIG